MARPVSVMTVLVALAIQPVAAMERALQIDTSSDPLPGTSVTRAGVQPPEQRQPSAPPGWEMGEQNPQSNWAGAPTSERAGLNWELVEPAVAPSPDQTEAAQPLITASPTWEAVVPGEEFTAVDVAREVDAQEAARQNALAELEGPDSGEVKVMSMSKAFTVNRVLYSDASITIPNAFKRDPQHFFTLSLIGTDQVRRPFTGCRGDNTCRDAELEAELAILQSGPVSLELLYNAASIGLNTNYGDQTLGFRLAANISPTIGLAFGGESLLYLDRTSDQRCSIYDSCAPLKGTSWFAVASAAFPLSSKSPTPPVIVATAGAGSGYYGFDGSGDDTRWGPIASLSLSPNQFYSFSAEYTGYGISAGVSIRPFEIPLVVSLFATDFLGNTPSQIKEFCPSNNCSARLLGRLTLSF